MFLPLGMPQIARAAAAARTAGGAAPDDLPPPPPLTIFFCTERLPVLYGLFSVSDTFWPSQIFWPYPIWAVGIALSVRRTYLGQHSPQHLVALIIIFVTFSLCLLVDCSPNLPAAVQTAISVHQSILLILMASIEAHVAGGVVYRHGAFHIQRWI